MQTTAEYRTGIDADNDFSLTHMMPFQRI